jgi:hypothetical protein
MQVIIKVLGNGRKTILYLTSQPTAVTNPPEPNGVEPVILGKVIKAAEIGAAPFYDRQFEPCTFQGGQLL